MEKIVTSGGGRLSIIVPVYNAAQWIRETIESVIAQEYTDWQLILVDDGSSDSSADIIHEYTDLDERVKYFKKPNGGVSSARNFGIEHSVGEYIAFLDSDDIALPRMYSTLIDSLERNNADAWFCAFTRFFKDGRRLTHIEPSFEYLCRDPRDIKYFLRSTVSVTDGDVLTTDDIHGSCCRNVYRRSIILDSGLRFNEKIRFAEDQIFVMSYLHECRSIGYTDEPLLMYRAQTKEWRHHGLYDSNMELLDRQLMLIQCNGLYTDRQKRKLAAYCKYAVYMFVINEDLMFRSDADKIIADYPREFKELLTFRGLLEKMKSRFDLRKIMLFVLLRLGMYKTVKRTFPNKRY